MIHVISLFFLASAHSDTLIRGATVLSFSETNGASVANILVSGQRIVRIDRRKIDVPDTTAIIDAEGKFLMPGLIEMHGHLPEAKRGPTHAEDMLFLFLAGGATTVRSMLGRRHHMAVRDKVMSGDILGPTLYLASPPFSGARVSDPAVAVARTEQYAKEGWDLLKILPGLRRPVFDAIAQQAAVSGIEFSGHVPQEVGLEHALASGLRTIEHLDGYIRDLGGETQRIPDAKLRDAARRTKAADVAVVPTMAVWDVLLSIPEIETLERYPELRYMPRDMVAHWRQQQTRSWGGRMKAFAKTLAGGPDKRIISENRRRLLTAMHEEGVEILFGTDSAQRYSVPGFSILREMKAMARSGLPNRYILKTATDAAGRFFAHKDTFGRIAVGARADLLLLDRDPIADLDALENPAGVMVRGRWISGQEIQRRLAEIAARHAH